MKKIIKGKCNGTPGIWVHTPTTEGHDEKFYAFPIEIENRHLVINSGLFEDKFYCITCSIGRLFGKVKVQHKKSMVTLLELSRAYQKYVESKQESTWVDE